MLVKTYVNEKNEFLRLPVSWFQLELIFFLVAGVILCCGFSLKIMWMTPVFQLLQSVAYTKSQSFQLLTAKSWEYTRSWDGTQTGQLTQTRQRDIPYAMGSRPAIILRKRRRSGGLQLLRDWLGISQWVVSISLCIRYCFKKILFILFFFFPLSY